MTADLITRIVLASGLYLVIAWCVFDFWWRERRRKPTFQRGTQFEREIEALAILLIRQEGQRLKFWDAHKLAKEEAWAMDDLERIIKRAAWRADPLTADVIAAMKHELSAREGLTP